MTGALIAAALISALIHTLWNIAAKRVTGNPTVFWLAQVVATILIAPWAVMVADGSLLHTKPLIFIGVSGLVQWLYFTLLSRAYTTGDLSVVYPIARGIGVAGVAITAANLLSESISPTGGAGIAFICLGTATIGLSGSLKDKSSVYYSLAIGLVLTMGGTIDKLAVGSVHPVFYIFCMFAISSLIGLPAALKRQNLTSTFRQHTKAIFTIGPGSLGGYLIILFAFQQGPMAYLIAMRESSVLFGSIVGIWLLGEHFSWRKGAGIAAIFAGLLLIRLA